MKIQIQAETYNPRHSVDCTCSQCKWWWSPLPEGETIGSMDTVSHTFALPRPSAIPPMSILISCSHVASVIPTSYSEGTGEEFSRFIQGGD